MRLPHPLKAFAGREFANQLAWNLVVGFDLVPGSSKVDSTPSISNDAPAIGDVTRKLLHMLQIWGNRDEANVE